MEREIKFKYYYKLCHPHTGWGDIHIAIITLEDLEKGKYKDIIGKLEESFVVEIIGKCQYTGLKDENKKEVFAGDIIEFITEDEGYEENIKRFNGWFIDYDIHEKCLVLRDRKENDLIPLSHFDYHANFNVIGNISESL
jgi:hypothetical protein